MSTVEISQEERDLWRFEASDECGTPSEEDERILRLLNVLETAEAEVARLTAERDWLAERCSECCEDDEMYSDQHEKRIVLWKEAARKDVDAGEGK